MSDIDDRTIDMVILFYLHVYLEVIILYTTFVRYYTDCFLSFLIFSIKIGSLSKDFGALVSYFYTLFLF